MMEEVNTDFLNKRNFLLMLSPGEGQMLSELAGFSAPSKEVQDNELVDVVSNWITLAASGNLAYIKKASTWISDFVIDIYGFPEEQRSQLTAAYFAYGVALLSYLLEVNAIDLYSTGEATDNLENFIEFLPGTFTVLSLDDEEGNSDE